MRKAKIGYRKLNIKEQKISFQKRDLGSNKNIKNIILKLNKNLLVNEKDKIFVVEFSKINKDKIIKFSVDQAIEIVRRRIDETGTNEPTIQQQGIDRIIVQLPGLEDPGRIKRLLGKTAKLTFQLGHPSIISEDIKKGSVAPPGFSILEDDKDPNLLYMINKRVMVSGEMLKDASSSFDRNNSPSVSFQLTALGGKKFGRVTGKNIGRDFAIVLDGKVVSAPTIQSQIFSSGQITGNFSTQETNDLALVIKIRCFTSSYDHFRRTLCRSRVG